MADLRSQRAAAANDVAQLRDGVAHLPARLPTDQPVRAGIHGVIRSLEAQAGTLTASGVPLVRMLDCDHAFLTVGPNSKQLHAGESVQVRLPNLPPVAATVRESSGVAEPPNAPGDRPGAGRLRRGAQRLLPDRRHRDRDAELRRQLTDEVRRLLPVA